MAIEETSVKEVAQTRVRMNVAITAKGFAQWDLTCESSTIEETQNNLDSAIKAIRKVIKDNGLKEAGSE